MNLFESRRIAELERQIRRYQNSYYNGEGEISDEEFDALWDELKILDPQNAALEAVGRDSGAFPKRAHVIPMGSQEKAADPEQFFAWAKAHAYPEYLVEYKLDGASLELQYLHGSLVRAVTRGDGSIGDDITANALKMRGVVDALRSGGRRLDFTGGIRGEVIMEKAVHEKHFSDKANCRNAANGLMRRKDGEGSEFLTLIVYDAKAVEEEALALAEAANPAANALAAEVQPFSDEEQKIRWLKELGFNTVRLEIFHSAEEVVEFREQVAAGRKNLAYDIDGLVVKEREIRLDDAMRARPDRQIAFKFSLEKAETTVRRVVWNESGATYTPVAEFDPVELAGTTVQRASLANPNQIRLLRLKIGSRVLVVKRGEIIPKIEAVLHEREDGPQEEVEFPQKCASCGSELLDEGTRLFCPNKACSKRVLHQIQKWISVIDIRDMGESLVSSLFKEKVLTSISSIYSLTEEKLAPFFLTRDSIVCGKESLGAKRVMASINARRKMSLAAFVGGFDIEGIGETQAQKVVEAGFNTLEKMLCAREEEVAAVYGFAEISARAFVQGMRENAQEMRSLALGAVSIEGAASGGSLEGKSFCFTGELRTMKRADAEALVKANGGSAKSSVVKDLSFLVTNDKESGSAKNQKAAKLGIPIISEDEFLAMVKKV